MLCYKGCPGYARRAASGCTPQESLQQEQPSQIAVLHEKRHRGVLQAAALHSLGRNAVGHKSPDWQIDLRPIHSLQQVACPQLKKSTAQTLQHQHSQLRGLDAPLKKDTAIS